MIINSIPVECCIREFSRLRRRASSATPSYFSPRTTQTSPWLPAKLRGGPLATTSSTACLDDKHSSLCYLYRQPILIPLVSFVFLYCNKQYIYYTVCPTFSRTTLIANSVKSYRPILIFLISEVSLGFCHLFGVHVIDV